MLARKNKMTEPLIDRLLLNENRIRKMAEGLREIAALPDILGEIISMKTRPNGLQIVAFPFAIIFGRLAKKYSAEKLITVCIVAYLGVAIFAIFLHYQWQFWVLAVWVGMFQGGVQALSRSYFTKIIPANQSGEFFGLMDICGKGASFMGTTIVSLISQITGNINIGVGMIAVLFVIGIILFRRAAALE